MLNRFGVSNFKAFGDQPAPVRLAPITLIYGPNSSGKSSIIQSLLLLKQSFENSKNYSRDGHIFPVGEYVDLGSMKSMMHKHELKNRLKFDLGIARGPSIEADYGLDFKYEEVESGRIVCYLDNISLHGKRKEVGTYSMSFYRCPKDEKTKLIEAIESAESDGSMLPGKVVLKRSECYRIASMVDIEQFSSQMAKVRELAGRKKRKPTKPDDSENLETLRDRYWANAARSFLPVALVDPTEKVNPFWFGGAPYEYAHIASGLMAFDSRLTSTLDDLIHLGPLRAAPARLYRLEDEEISNVGKAGSNSIPLIYRDMLLTPSGGKTILDEINRISKEFEIPYSFALKTYGDMLTGVHLSLELTDSRTNTAVLPTDVGFGISQLLPILIEGTLSKHERKHSIICVEQPEIHLHPRLQALMADFFINTIVPAKELKKVKEADDLKFGHTQWLIETHSEALIYRVLRRIKEGLITPQDVSVLYVEPRGARGSRIVELRVDENGEFIDNWPDGFFVESLSDIFEGFR